jgi:hypothetical protein
MCSGKIAVLSLLATHKTGGEFMCSGKIAVLPLFCVGLVEKELLSFQNK